MISIEGLPLSEYKFKEAFNVWISKRDRRAFKAMFDLRVQIHCIEGAYCSERCTKCTESGWCQWNRLWAWSYWNQNKKVGRAVNGSSKKKCWQYLIHTFVYVLKQWCICQVYNLSIFSNCSCKVFFYLTCNLRFLLQCGIFFHPTTTTIIFASQGLRSALLIFTLGIVRRIFKVTQWRFICNAASGSCNQSERTLHFPSSCQQRHLFRL